MIRTCNGLVVQLAHDLCLKPMSPMFVRPKARSQGIASAAKTRQQRAGGTGPASLHSSKTPHFRIANSPAASPSVSHAAAEQRRRLLTGSALNSHTRNSDPTTPMQRQRPVLHDDTIEAVDDSEMPSSAHPDSRSRAVHPRDLNIEATDAVITPEPRWAEDGAGAIAGSTGVPYAPERTPATGHTATNGATTRHALLARLATTPKSDLSRLKPQQRPQVQMRLR